MLIAHSLLDITSYCTPHKEVERGTVQLFQVKGSSLAQKPGHSPKACPFTQYALSTHRNLEHIFLGSRLVASYSITNIMRGECVQATKRTLRRSQSAMSLQAGVLNSSALLKLKKFLQTFERWQQSRTVVEEILSFSRSLYLNNKVTRKEKP